MPGNPAFIDKKRQHRLQRSKSPNATILDGKNNPPRSRPDPVPGSLPAQRLISPPHPSEKKNAHVHLRPSKYCHAILYKIRFRICVPGRFRASQTFASPLHISVGQLRGSQNRPPDEGIKLTFFPFTRVPGSSGNRKFHLPSNPPLARRTQKKKRRINWASALKKEPEFRKISAGQSHSFLPKTHLAPSTSPNRKDVATLIEQGPSTFQRHRKIPVIDDFHATPHLPLDCNST